MAHNGCVPSGPWEFSVTPIAPPMSANPRLRQLAYAGLVTGLWSGLICVIIFGLCRLAGVPFLLAVGGAPGADADPTLRLTWFEVMLVPLAVAGVDAVLLDPRATWADGAAYDAQAARLVRMFADNFGKYVAVIDDDVRAAAIG